MKTLKLVVLATLVAFSAAVNGQDYAFKVLANKGNNEIKSGESWQPLKTGATLRSNDEVKLADNAYVGLVHNSGKPVEVKEAGVHKVSALESKVGNGSSVLNKYTDFILSSNSAEAQKNRLNATGAVHREVIIGPAAPIRLILPDKDNAGIFDKTAVINWNTDVAGPYVVTIQNMFEDVLTRTETPENSYVIDLNDKKYAEENALLIQISAKSDPHLVSNSHLIKRLTPAELDKISALMKDVKVQLGDVNAMNKLYLAGFYEQNNLLIDAITAYEQAIKLEPEVPSFRESYDDFLIRNNLR
jgi:hypothetical protein